MLHSKTFFEQLEEKWDKKRRNPDKRDAAEKSPTAEVLHEMTVFPTSDENSGDVGPNTSVPAGQDPDKPAR